MDSTSNWFSSPFPFMYGWAAFTPANILHDEHLEGEPTSTTDGPNSKALEDELARERARFLRLKAESDASVEERRNLEDEIQELKELLEVRDRELGRRGVQIQQSEKDKATMRAKLAELSSAETRAQELATRLTEKDKIISERTTELNAAQVFLTKVDTISEAELVALVDNLNTLIFTVSGVLSDAWDQREHIPGLFTEESDIKRTRDAFGDLMVERIAARDPVAVNLAIQAYLGQFIERTTSGWGTGEGARDLAEIYGAISSKENQTVASTWKALTKRCMPQQEPPKSKEIVDDLGRILMVTHTFSALTEAREVVTSSAGAEIEAIIEATVQLDDTIRTKIASSEMTVYIVPRGTIFTEEFMVDEFNEDGQGGGGGDVTVAGTMEIGLLRRTEKAEKVLRKPKVILERDLVEQEGWGKGRRML